MTSFRWVCNNWLPKGIRQSVQKSMCPIFATHPWERGLTPSGNHRTTDCESVP